MLNLKKMKYMQLILLPALERGGKLLDKKYITIYKRL
jgi:hypothetical protein